MDHSQAMAGLSEVGRNFLAAGIGPVVGIDAVGDNRHVAVAERNHLEAGLDKEPVEDLGSRLAGKEEEAVLQSLAVDQILDYRKT